MVVYAEGAGRLWRLFILFYVYRFICNRRGLFFKPPALELHSNLSLLVLADRIDEHDRGSKHDDHGGDPAHKHHHALLRGGVGGRVDTVITEVAENGSYDGSGDAASELSGERAGRIDKARGTAAVDELGVVGRVTQHSEEEGREECGENLTRNANGKNGRHVLRTAKSYKRVDDASGHESQDEKVLLSELVAERRGEHGSAD